jgi:hypothetical protein
VSEEQLVNAYVRGEISRRIFIRRLMAGGIGLGAALAYARLLTPESARAASRPADHYEHKAEARPRPRRRRKRHRRRRHRRHRLRRRKR